MSFAAATCADQPFALALKVGSILVLTVFCLQILSEVLRWWWRHRHGDRPRPPWRAWAARSGVALAAAGPFIAGVLLVRISDPDRIQALSRTEAFSSCAPTGNEGLATTGAWLTGVGLYVFLRALIMEYLRDSGMRRRPKLWWATYTLIALGCLVAIFRTEDLELALGIFGSVCLEFTLRVLDELHPEEAVPQQSQHRAHTQSVVADRNGLSNGLSSTDVGDELATGSPQGPGDEHGANADEAADPPVADVLSDDTPDQPGCNLECEDEQFAPISQEAAVVIATSPDRDLAHDEDDHGAAHDANEPLGEARETGDAAGRPGNEDPGPGDDGGVDRGFDEVERLEGVGGPGSTPRGEPLEGSGDLPSTDPSEEPAQQRGRGDDGEGFP